MVFRRIEFWIEGDRGAQIRLSKQEWNAEKIGKKGIKWFLFLVISFFIANVFLAYLISSDELFKMIEEAGFKIVALKATRLSPALAGKFYEVHSERPFYKDLCAYMSSAPIFAAILEKNNTKVKISALKESLNPITTFELNLKETDLPTIMNWQIK